MFSRTRQIREQKESQTDLCSMSDSSVQAIEGEETRGHRFGRLLQGNLDRAVLVLDSLEVAVRAGNSERRVDHNVPLGLN